ncbi:MAG: MATE family efflux transporter [Planctomycetota bacterium]|nr:MAG: MATE family efflux transporter [Planctomycetota bacterium]
MPPSLVDTPGTLRPMLRLAVPVLAEQSLHVLVGFSDTILAGQYLSTAELAAMGMLNYVLWAIETCFAIVAVGATAVIARSIGARDVAAARCAVHQSFLLGIVLAVALMLVGYALAEPLVRALGLTGQAAENAVRYIRFLLAILPLMMAEFVGIACLRAAGDTAAGLIVMLGANCVNVAVSWSLVRGIETLGIARLGWDGLAIGTSLAFACAGVAILAMLVRGRAGLKLSRSELKPHRATMRRILHVGLPGGGDQLAIVFCHLLYVRAINGLGELATAAHGVGVRIESMSYLPGFAFHVAAQTLVGQFLGARDPRRATRSALVTLAVGGGLMVASGAVMFFAPQVLTRLFINAEETEVLALANRLLPIVGVGMPALAVIAILGGALRGAGDTRLPIVFTFVGLIVVRLPLCYWLAYETIPLPFLDAPLAGWNLGVVGAWYAMVIDATVRCALVLTRFVEGGWRKVKV